MSTEPMEIYEFGGFRLDVGEHKLTRCDGTAHADGSLPEKAFRTLVHLVRQRGTLVTHDELLEAVWPGAVVEKNNIGKAVHAVRSFLDDTNGKPRFIETVPKHGYRFLAEVRTVWRRRALERRRRSRRAESIARSRSSLRFLRSR